MELHSYAKRRTPMKCKFYYLKYTKSTMCNKYRIKNQILNLIGTIEQKRKLVEARITHDAWFTNKPSSLVPWK